MVVGILGFVWLVLWRRTYHPPETHPRVTRGRAGDDPRRPRRGARGGGTRERAGPPRWAELLRLRQTWGAIAAKGLTDPVWFMIADWFAIYLASRRATRSSRPSAGYWVPFLGSDLGNLFGGTLLRAGSSAAAGRSAARDALVIAGGSLGVFALVPAAFASSYVFLLACFAVATFSYAAMSTMALSFPADLFQSRDGGDGRRHRRHRRRPRHDRLATFTIGVVADRFSFTPILVVASFVPVLAAVLVLALVRNTPESGRGVLKVI